MLLIALLAAAVVQGGCTIPGRIYIAFLWTDSEAPDTFTCDVPSVPSLASLVRGRYYLTVPGQYTLQYTYASPPATWNLSFILSVDSTVMGQESAYYHATLRKTAAPTVEPYP